MFRQVSCFAIINLYRLTRNTKITDELFALKQFLLLQANSPVKYLRFRKTLLFPKRPFKSKLSSLSSPAKRPAISSSSKPHQNPSPANFRFLPARVFVLTCILCKTFICNDIGLLTRSGEWVQAFFPPSKLKAHSGGKDLPPLYFAPLSVARSFSIPPYFSLPSGIKKARQWLCRAHKYKSPI